MKTLITTLALFLSSTLIFAHDHIETGVSPSDETQLEMNGPNFQVSTYFPLGEAPVGLSETFPGGYFASILSFSSDGQSFETPPSPTRVWVEIVSVTGPVGGAFAFWEVGATSPTISRATGWTASVGDSPSFRVSEYGLGPGDAYGHIHGRVFTTTKAGNYTVTFRAVDSSGTLGSSANKTITFRAVEPPQLAISVQDNTVKLSFTSRINLTYDVQSSTTLAPGSWQTLTLEGPIDGDGGTQEFSDPLNNRARVFYRLLESL